MSKINHVDPKVKFLFVGFHFQTATHSSFSFNLNPSLQVLHSPWTQNLQLGKSEQSLKIGTHFPFEFLENMNEQFMQIGHDCAEYPASQAKH